MWDDWGCVEDEGASSCHLYLNWEGREVLGTIEIFVNEKLGGERKKRREYWHSWMIKINYYIGKYWIIKDEYKGLWKLVRFMNDWDFWYSWIIILESIESLKMNKGLWDLWRFIMRFMNDWNFCNWEIK